MSQVLSHFIFTETLSVSKWHHYSYFTGEETLLQRSVMTYPSAHSWLVAELGIKPRSV